MVRAAAARPALARHGPPHPRALSVDWTRPWLAPLRQPGQRLHSRLARGMTVAQALDEPLSPRRFVDAAALPPGEAYETFIARTGAVPTRENLHDFFNGLVWHAEPVLKARMNQLHAQAIAERGVGARRGPLRDALTLFDENGALLHAPAPLLQALQGRDWHALFVQQRALWQQARLRLVGHALLEKLTLAPRKAVTAHVWVGGDDILGADARAWQAKPFAPLPVLGVPGWWPANEDPAFYADEGVFRPAKSPFATRVRGCAAA